MRPEAALSNAVLDTVPRPKIASFFKESGGQEDVFSPMGKTRIADNDRPYHPVAVRAFAAILWKSGAILLSGQYMENVDARRTRGGFEISRRDAQENPVGKIGFSQPPDHKARIYDRRGILGALS